MPLDRFLLILASAVVAAGVTIWLAAMVSLPALAGTVAIPAALVGYLVWRAIAGRFPD